MSLTAVPDQGAGDQPARRKVIVQRSMEFGVTTFDITDDEQVTLWVGGELVAWFKAGAVEAVYYADIAKPHAG